MERSKETVLAHRPPSLSPAPETGPEASGPVSQRIDLPASGRAVQTRCQPADAGRMPSAPRTAPMTSIKDLPVIFVHLHSLRAQGGDASRSFGDEGEPEGERPGVGDAGGDGVERWQV